MSNRIWTVAAAAAVLGLMASSESSASGSDVAVEVIGADGSRFEQFPAKSGGNAYRSFLQAERNAHYRIRIRNCTGERVAVVVAVDGRNIISGAQSELGRTEPMYILGAYETQDFSGWRTSATDVHEFYFTEWQDSYAEAFGDRSARGVIAVAAFHEKLRPVYQPKLNDERRPSREAPATQSSPPVAGDLANARGRAESDKKDAESSAGTGFGDQRYDPVTWVQFETENRASARVFLKYEWQETLCRKGVIDCGEKNRFWKDDYAYAPFPPGRDR